MLWKSNKQKRREVFERALAEMPSAASQVSEKWANYCTTFAFKDGVSLTEQIRLFSIPLAGFFRTAYPNISKTDPIVYLGTLIIGVYLAKTHPIPEVLAVARHLDKEMGVSGIEELVAQFIKGTPNR